MELIFGIFVGVVVLVFLVVIHELGHAVVARRNGVVVEEFGIGFPPKAWAKKLKNGVLFTVNWLPLGGFVKLKGEHDADNKKGDYGAASYWQKTKILLAGVTVNWFFAVFLFTLLSLVGLPKLIGDQFHIASDTKIISAPVIITEVQTDSPAKDAGLLAGDEIVVLDGQPVKSLTSFTALARELAGKTVEIEYVRGDDLKTSEITLRQDEQKGALGVGLSGSTEKYRVTWSAPIVGFMTTVQLTDANLRGLGDMVGSLFRGNTKQVSESVAGPIGILGVLFPSASKAGFTSVVLLAAIISLALAIMNLLPIPGLDGGRWLTMTLFKLSGKKLTKEMEDKINGAGILFLFALIILVTLADVSKIF